MQPDGIDLTEFIGFKNLSLWQKPFQYIFKQKKKTLFWKENTTVLKKCVHFWNIKGGRTFIRHDCHV